MTTKDELDYAWSWFRYHAGQRMAAFRFFLILLAALVLAMANAPEEGDLIFVWMIGGFGAFVSFAFLVLEIRNEALVDVGRNALSCVEESDVSLKAEPRLQLIGIERKHCFWTSHSLWLRAIYVVCIALFLCTAYHFAGRPY